VLRKKLAVLLAAAMMVMAVSPAWAAPGNGQGYGQGIGGGNATHGDSGQHTATGGGQLNNPNLCPQCGPV
jgi:hypothetical protein